MVLPCYLPSKQLLLLVITTTIIVIPIVALTPWLQSNRHVSNPCLYFTELGDCDGTSGRSATLIRSTRQSNNSRKHIRRKSFDDMYPKLVAFKDEHGHTHVTKDQDRELYLWMRNLRYNYLWQIRNWPDPTGKRKRLSDDKLQRLSELDFSWDTKRDWKRWPTMLDDLTNYKRQYGTTHVNPSVDRDLYEWTRSIRNNYRHQALNRTMLDSNTSVSSRRRPRLSPRKMKALNDIGFDWEPQERQDYLRWEDMIIRLESFVAEYGHTRVPKDYHDRNLYRWTQNVISNYGHQLSNTTTPASMVGRRHYLSEKRLQQLEELGFDWEQRSTMWERHYQELYEYWKKNGHCHVQALQSRKLCTFVQNQRQEYRRFLAGQATSLTPGRMEALQRINFDFDRSHDKLWNQRHDDFQVFVDATGSVNVPQDFSSNYQLGQWTMNQRTKYRQRQNGLTNGLTDARINELEKRGFSWNVHESRWKAMYHRLKKYQEENDHMDIPTSDSSNSDLRLWLNAQRHFYKAKNMSRLSEGRIELLESIPGFSWRGKRTVGPSKDDWSQLFVAIREKGIAPGARAKQHWFEGTNRWAEVKTEWTEQELLALWNEEDDDDEDEGDFFEDEESRLFLRA